MLWNSSGDRSETQRSFNNSRKQSNAQQQQQQQKQQRHNNSKQYLQLPNTETANAHQHKRNSFHGYAFASSSSSSSPGDAAASVGGAHSATHKCQPTLLVSVMNDGAGPNSYGRSSLLQLPNGHNWSSAVGSQDTLLSPSPSFTSLSPTMLRSQHSTPTTTPPSSSGGGGGGGAPTTTAGLLRNAAAFARTAKTSQCQQQHNNARPQCGGSTDSAPVGVGTTAEINGERKKRMELWALAPSTAFHQSIDMRSTATDESSSPALSTSCGHIAGDEATAVTSAMGACGRSGSVNDGSTTAASDLAAASGYHSERRSAFCSGGTSRDHGRQQHGRAGTGTQMLMFCTASGCSGHAPCAGHRPPPLRSAQSSIDETAGESGLACPLRDTYLTEISREWMRMNGAIAPFRNILQQASSVASTPLPNHRPIVQSPAAPAAAAAASTASAILGPKATGADDELGGESSSSCHAMVEAIQGSCHNLATVTAAATTEQRIVDQFVVRSKGAVGSANDVAGCAGGSDPVIIIEPRAMSQKRYSRSRSPSGDPLLKKSLSLVLSDDVEAQRTGAVSAVPGGGGGGGSAGGGNAPSEKGAQGSVVMNINDAGSACSARHSLVKEKERGGRFIKRQQLFNKRRITSDYALFFAIFGIVLMIIENEFVYAGYGAVCVLLKLIILLSTICLVGLVVKFHVHEIQIFMNANSAEDWQIALTCRKSMQIVVEIIACAICPLPVQIDVYVSTVNSDGHTVPMRMPLDVLFSILMFFRLYWLCRVMLLHSRLFTDAASRSIAGLNRVKTDAKFILKTLMTICPGTMLLLFTASLWMIGGYILRLCERHHELHTDTSLLHNNMHANKHQSYLNSLWLIAVTFLSIGYGDIVPNTQCGRIMAVVTGILGTCTSSMVVAVIARKLELTRAEKHVHNFMIETQHTKQLKHIAANVLRETWLIYKHRCLVDKIEPSKIRHHQRKFLVAICALRKLKTSQRKLDENRISLGDVAKTTSHSHDLMREVQSTQEGLALRITAVEHQLSDIQREVSSIGDMLRSALRPSSASLEFGPVQHQLQQHQNHQTASGDLFPVRQRRKPSMMAD